MRTPIDTRRRSEPERHERREAAAESRTDERMSGGEQPGASAGSSTDIEPGHPTPPATAGRVIPATDGTLEASCVILVERAFEVLMHGVMEIEGRFAHGSNHTFLAKVEAAGLALHAVYKPRAGERPLWDFPEGSLYLREVAAWRISEALGWRFVPPTVLRDGPAGEGMLQLFIPHDPEDHYLVMDRPDETAIDRIAAFDIVINNADRKSGHVLRSEDGALWAIDHGVSFHAMPKLRTVIWERAGLPLPAGVAHDLERLRGALGGPGGGGGVRGGGGDRESRRVIGDRDDVGVGGDREGRGGGGDREDVGEGGAPESLAGALAALLSRREIAAVARRIDRLLAAGSYPAPSDDRREFPWPPV